MKHLKGFNTLNRTHAHRRALYRNMVEALIENEKITTTVAKAKELRRVAEKIITKAKVKNLHTIRQINKLIKNETLLMKLFNDIAPRYEKRNGGYTRIIKLAARKGDGAEMCIIELLGEEEQVSKKKKAKKKVAAPKAEKVAVEASAEVTEAQVEPAKE